MIFIDANIFMYAAGRDSEWKRPCQRFLLRVLESQDRGSRQGYCTNTEVLQEILHRYCALQRREMAFQVMDSVFSLSIPVLPITETDLFEARQLLAACPALGPRDAVHVAVMRNNGIEKVATYDRGFSAVPWVKRIEPGGVASAVS